MEVWDCVMLESYALSGPCPKSLAQNHPRGRFEIGSALSMRFFVTGATGFLGGHLLTSLRREGHSIHVWARASSDVSGLGDVGVSRGAWTDAEALREAMRGCDVVVHAAGGGKVLRIADIYRTNVDSTRAVVEAAVAAGVPRFVLVSSLAACGASNAGRPRVESDPPEPLSHYGRSKLQAEGVLLEATALHGIIIRPPAVYGPGDTRMVALYRAASRGVLPMVAPEGSLSLVYGPDCADVIVRASVTDVPSGRAYFVADGEPHPRVEFARQIGAAVGRRVRVVPVPGALVRAAGAINEAVGRARGKSVILSRDKAADMCAPHQTCDASLAREELGFVSTLDFEEGARVTAAAYREAGWI